MSSLFSIFNWCQFNKENIISEIKSGKYDLNAIDDGGKTILMHAALMWEYDTNDIVSALIDMNVDINAQDHEEQNTALHYSIKNGKKTVVQLLLKAGANVHAFNKDRETPIFYACNPNYGINSQEILLALIKYGASVNDKNAYGETPLIKAVKKTKPSLSWVFIIQLLIYNGANVHVYTNDNKTIFDICDYEIQKVLTEFINQQVEH